MFLLVCFITDSFGEDRLSSKEKNLSFRDTTGSGVEKTQLLPLLLQSWAIYLLGPPLSCGGVGALIIPDGVGRYSG